MPGILLLWFLFQSLVGSGSRMTWVATRTVVAHASTSPPGPEPSRWLRTANAGSSGLRRCSRTDSMAFTSCSGACWPGRPPSQRSASLTTWSAASSPWSASCEGVVFLQRLARPAFLLTHCTRSKYCTQPSSYQNQASWDACQHRQRAFYFAWAAVAGEAPAWQPGDMNAIQQAAVCEQLTQSSTTSMLCQRQPRVNLAAMCIAEVRLTTRHVLQACCSRTSSSGPTCGPPCMPSGLATSWDRTASARWVQTAQPLRARKSCSLHCPLLGHTAVSTTHMVSKSALCHVSALKRGHCPRSTMAIPSAWPAHQLCTCTV